MIYRKKPVKKMTNEELLQDLISIQRWAGDDFAIHQIPASESRRGYKIEAEILARMSK